MEEGEGSGSKPNHEYFSKLDEQGVNDEGNDMKSLEDDFKSLLIVPSNSKYSDDEFLYDEMEIHSDVEVSSFENIGWCKITRNSDFALQNKRLNVNFSDGNDVTTEDTIISGLITDGIEDNSNYRFKMMPMNESSKKVFKAMWQTNDEALAVVNSDKLLKPHPVTSFKKKARSKRSRKRFMPEEDIYDMKFTCAQCEKEYGGFHCNKNTLHLQCYACQVMMPFRTNIRVPQQCVGCGRPFCGVYLQSQLITKDDSNHTCTLKPIGEHNITKIPLVAHERNRHEQDITHRCMQQMGKTLQDVVSEWVTKLNNQEIDRTGLPLNNAEMLESGTHICTIYLMMQHKGKIVGMATCVEHNTIIATMLVK